MITETTYGLKAWDVKYSLTGGGVVPDDLTESLDTLPSLSMSEIELLTSPEIMRQIMESDEQIKRGIKMETVDEVRREFGL